MTLVLLIATGLMVKSANHLWQIDPGFDTSGMLTVSVSVPRQAVPASQTPPAAGQPAPPPPPYLVTGKELLERVRAVPGVTDAALASDVPLTGNGGAVFYSAEGDTTTDAQTIPRAYTHQVSASFFQTMRMPIKAGRTFIDSEVSAKGPAVIVSENVIKRFWPGQDPIGKRIKFGPPASNNPWLTIVGVVPETKYRALPANPTNDPDLYQPALDRSPQPLLIRTSLPPSSILSAVRAAIRYGQPAVAVFAAQTMDELVATQTSASRFTMWVLGLFAVTALILSAIGIYGVMSYLVTQRWREFSIRLALGATRRDILGVVVRHGAQLIAIGAAIGIAAALGLSRVFASALYGVTTFDVSSIVAIVVLVGSALLACVIPAFRATRVDPATTLRS
jgi:putative ABC transport system permease protein